MTTTTIPPVRPIISRLGRLRANPKQELYGSAAGIGDNRDGSRPYRQVVEQDIMPYFRYAESAVAPVVTVEGRPRTMLSSANDLGLANPLSYSARRMSHRPLWQHHHRASSAQRHHTAGAGVGRRDRRLDWPGRRARLHQWLPGRSLRCSAPATPPSSTAPATRHCSRVAGCPGRRPTSSGTTACEALTKARAAGGSTLVVVDGLYSMYGDLAPLAEIGALCAEFGAALMVDEAHSTGLLGTRLTGAAEAFGVAEQVDIHMGALSKGLGSTGGFIAGSRELIDHLRMNARSLLFTTAATPASLGAGLAAIRVCRNAEGRELAEAALSKSAYLSNAPREAGFALRDSHSLRTA